MEGILTLPARPAAQHAALGPTPGGTAPDARRGRAPLTPHPPRPRPCPAAPSGWGGGPPARGGFVRQEGMSDTRTPARTPGGGGVSRPKAAARTGRRRREPEPVPGPSRAAREPEPGGPMSEPRFGGESAPRAEVDARRAARQSPGGAGGAAAVDEQCRATRGRGGGGEGPPATRRAQALRSTGAEPTTPPAARGQDHRPTQAKQRPKREPPRSDKQGTAGRGRVGDAAGPPAASDAPGAGGGGGGSGAGERSFREVGSASRR